jgi:tetratricopeptide (TPR) repeat protein
MNTPSRFLIFLGAATMLVAQKAPTASPGGGGGTASPGNTGTTGTVINTPGNNPTLNPSNPNNPTNDPFANQPIFLSGKVMFDDGSPTNKDVHVERVCGTNVRTEAYVDRSGHFSFQIGGGANNADIMMDASQSGYGSANPNGNNNQDSLGGMPNSISKRMGSETALWGCELRAAYPGYRSEVISLAGRKALDNPDVGTIILHHLGNVQGTTISLTTAEAPKSAKKNFEKGVQAAQKGNLPEAESKLQAATEEYPKYAIAWFMLGRVQEQQNRADDARKSYLSAIEADKHYVSPLDELALMAARENKWDDAARYSKQVIDLNPVEFPSSYWYNTVANYNLNKEEDAVKSAKALVKLDTQHRFPEVNRLLAELSANGKDYTSAAGYLKTYLTQVPNAKDADVLKQQLLKIEAASVDIKK